MPGRIRNALTRTFRTRADRIMGVVVLAVIISIAGASVISSASASRAENQNQPTRTLRASATTRRAITSTARRFITDAGTFGLDWSKVTDSTDVQSVGIQWGGTDSTNVDSMDDSTAAMVTTRLQAMTALRSAGTGGTSMISDDSDWATATWSDTVSYSDAMILSGFSVDEDSIRVSWSNAFSTMENGSAVIAVDASWTTRWSRSTASTVPDYAPDKSTWKPETMSLRFSHVRLTFQRDSTTKTWKILRVGDESGYSSLHDHGFALCTTGRIAYDSDGTVTSRSVNVDDGSDDDDE